MRFDVPNVGDPLELMQVLFFVQKQRVTIRLRCIDVLGKGTQAGLINEIGFGQDFLENKYLVTTNLQLTSNWKNILFRFLTPLN
jgi:hypothetical protein